MKRKRNAYHHGDLKAALVEAATKLVKERGAAAVSIREVARAVGVSHAAPYRHFRSRKALLEAVAIGGFRSLRDAIDIAIEQNSRNVRRQAIEAGAVYVREAIGNAERAQLMFGGVLQKGGASPALRNAAEEAFSRCVRIIRQGQEEGAFRSGSTRGLVMAFWAASHGLAMLLISNPFGVLRRDEDPDALWRTVGEHLLAGLLAD